MCSLYWGTSPLLEENKMEAIANIVAYNLITCKGSMLFAVAGWLCTVQEWDRDKTLETAQA